MPYKILIINPNSTQSMTDALKPLIANLSYPDIEYTYFTAPPSSPPSINSREDIQASLYATLPAVTPLVKVHDAVLVACYSPHPLVSALRTCTKAPVMGIMESSVGAAIQLIVPGGKFGIVSTGSQWEEILGEAVGLLLDGKSEWGAPELEQRSQKQWEHGSFAGVETTGLNATELHDAPQDLVRQRVQEATKRLVDKPGVQAILLGCAGMSGMDGWVKEIAGPGVWVIDGVIVGITALQGVLRARS